MKNNSAKIYPGVSFGNNFILGDFSIIGEPPRGRKPGELKTILGDDCTIRSHSVIYAGNIIGHRFQTGHYVFLREENEIGDDVSIGTMSMIEHHVKIGNSVRIHSQAFIPEFSVLEDDCWIGPNVVLTNAPYPRAERTKEFLAGVIIRKGAKLGANCTILPGIEIGEMALVGAGAVVTKNVPRETVVAGNPAQIIKSIHELKFPDGGIVYPGEV
ncbi:N-acetyltransferase [Candidatus Sumerlaeota bacterium]|nr:N-acetyltransferase [Candidatus Sumerlaeota bacterium]